MALRLSEGLGLSARMELLDYTLPPAFSDLKLDKGPRGGCGDDIAPKRLCSVVGWHLTYFPGAWMTLEDMQRQRATGP